MVNRAAATTQLTVTSIMGLMIFFRRMLQKQHANQVMTAIPGRVHRLKTYIFPMAWRPQLALGISVVANDHSDLLDWRPHRFRDEQPAK